MDNKKLDLLLDSLKLDSLLERLLEKTEKGSGGEIQLTDAIKAMLKDYPYLAYRFAATRYDCGSKLGYLQATVEYALRHPELGKPFKSYLDERHMGASINSLKPR